jgi:ParB-like chromosome segregation protein Spo0J|tara:strand:+ start:488 stop:745 length:258 start_codon:yes stop_codon:yes gene_type:complete
MANKIVSVKELVFGVNRPQRWWDEHPDQQKIFENIKESIKNNGMKKPLEVTIDKRGYVVEVGNQRLRALLELGITTAPCLVTKRI